MIYWYEFRVQGSHDSDGVGTWSRADAVKWLAKNPSGWVNVYDSEDHIYTVMLGASLLGCK